MNASDAMPDVDAAEVDDVVEKLGTAGFVAKGVLYIIIGLTTASLIAGSGEESQQGAIATVANLPFGSILLVLLIIGLAGYSILRLVHAVRDPSGEDGLKSVGYRISYVARALTYAALAFVAVQELIGGSSGSGSGGSGGLTRTVLDLPGGAVILGIAGAIGIGVGLYQAYSGITRRFERHIRGATGTVKTVTTWSGAIGHVARGLVFGTVGVLLLQAALSGSSQDGVGLDAAIGELSSATAGTILVSIIGLGLIGYGIYCLGVAKYGRAIAVD